MIGKKPIPFAQESSKELNTKAARYCKVRFIREGTRVAKITVEGCPACEHDTLFEQPTDVIDVTKAGGGPGSGDRGTGTFHLTIVCHCGVKHPGVSEGEVGCGRYWALVIGGH
jgi:hypothetical protein